jgi:hypothetical protein
LFVVLGLIIFPVIVCLLLFLNEERHCSEKNKIPSYPVFPGAIQIYENKVGTNFPVVTRIYQTRISPEEVRQFYKENTSCRPSQNPSNGVCIADASPDGEIFIYIPSSPDANTGLLEFTIEVTWEGCSSSFQPR